MTVRAKSSGDEYGTGLDRCDTARQGVAAVPNFTFEPKSVIPENVTAMRIADSVQRVGILRCLLLKSLNASNCFMQ